MVSFDTYRWVKKNGAWKLESVSEDGKERTLPDNVIPTGAPSRFDEIPDYAKWNKSPKGTSKFEAPAR